MKKTLSLPSLLFTGVALLANPQAAILAAQSADIDAMSGATITWENYTASVQSALDAAGFTG